MNDLWKVIQWSYYVAKPAVHCFSHQLKSYFMIMVYKLSLLNLLMLIWFLIIVIIFALCLLHWQGSNDGDFCHFDTRYWKQLILPMTGTYALNFIFLNPRGPIWIILVLKFSPFKWAECVMCCKWHFGVNFIVMPIKTSERKWYDVTHVWCNTWHM